MSDFEEFAELEERLRKELRPVDAPVGFAERVMQRVEKTNRPVKVVPFRSSRVRWRGWVSGAVAASLAAGIFAGVRVREVHRAQVAQRQFDTALRVTSTTLEKTREQLQRVGVQLDGNKGETE